MQGPVRSSFNTASTGLLGIFKSNTSSSGWFHQVLFQALLATRTGSSQSRVVLTSLYGEYCVPYTILVLPQYTSSKPSILSRRTGEK